MHVSLISYIFEVSKSIFVNSNIILYNLIEQVAMNCKETDNFNSIYNNIDCWINNKYM